MEVIISGSRKCGQFVTIFQHLKAKISEINLTFDDKKLYMQGMDGSHIGLFELELISSWFKKYYVTESVILGINCELFYKMLNCIDNTHDIILSFTNDGDTLDIALTSEEKGVLDKQFNLPLMDINSELMHIPSMDYSVDLRFKSSIFEKIIEELLIFAQTVSVTCSEEMISLKTTKASSMDCGAMDVKINFDDLLEYAIEEDLVLNLIFSLNYLNWMVQFSKLSSEVGVHFKKDIPMKMVYILDENCFIQFFLAPQFDEF